MSGLDLFPRRLDKLDDQIARLLGNDVGEHKSVGIVSATRGYLDLSRFETIVDQPSKPVVARNLLAGEFDAG